jgi:hypothetical protein
MHGGLDAWMAMGGCGYANDDMIIWTLRFIIDGLCFIFEMVCSYNVKGLED